jgi:hypothetical protein
VGSPAGISIGAEIPRDAAPSEKSFQVSGKYLSDVGEFLSSLIPDAMNQKKSQEVIETTEQHWLDWVTINSKRWI